MNPIFHVRGVTLHLQEGDVILLPGDNMQMQQQGNTVTFTASVPANVLISGTPWMPPALSNGTSPNNSLYYAIGVNKLTFKDSAGNTHVLY